MRYAVIGFCLFAGACAGAAPTGPTSSDQRSVSSAQLQTRVAPSTESCTVDIGSTVHSLPLIQLIQAWLNISINDAASSLNCGQVQSLNAKLNVVAEKSMRMCQTLTRRVAHRWHW